LSFGTPFLRLKVNKELENRYLFVANIQTKTDIVTKNIAQARVAPANAKAIFTRAPNVAEKT
jgi:hypothetical protein